MSKQSRPYVGPCDHYVSVVVSSQPGDAEREDALMCLYEWLETGEQLLRQTRMQLYDAQDERDRDMILSIIALSRVPADQRAKRHAERLAAETERQQLWDDHGPERELCHTKADGEPRPIKSPRQARVQRYRCSRKLRDRNRWQARQAKELG